MTDRYLSKAKRTDNGKWVIGPYVVAIDKRGVQQHNILVADKRYGYFDWIVVDSTSVCQCTGVPDRDRVIMYENDIVRAYNGVRGIIRFGRYGEQKTDYGFYVEWEKSQPDWRNDIYYWNNEVRVIGSYIDNPELFEAKE